MKNYKKINIVFVGCLIFLSSGVWGATDAPPTGNDAPVRKQRRLKRVPQDVSEPAAAQPADAKTLRDCFQAAIKRSDDVLMDQELIRQAEQNYRQAIGSIMPNLSGVGAYQWQQANPNSGYNNLYPNPSTASRLTVTQPLFEGLKEYAGLSQTKKLIGASRADKENAEMALYESVAATYFAIVAGEHDVENLDRELGYYDQRIKETEQFKRIGRAQYSDVLTIQAQKATLNAQKENVIATLTPQREVLAFLTGWDANTSVVRPPKAETTTARPLEEYIARLEARPDVVGDAQRLKAAEEGIPIARAGHFPTLGLQADYYLQRTGPLDGVNWDAMLMLTVPIFAGFTVDAQVEEAVSKRDQAEYQVSKTKRTAIEQIRTFYRNYIGDQRQYTAYSEASDLAEKNYKEEVRQYRFGLVTNLDVLTALTNFIEDERSRDKSLHSLQLDVQNLEASGAFVSDIPSSSGDKKN